MSEELVAESVVPDAPIVEEAPIAEPASNPAAEEATPIEAPKEEFQFDEDILQETEQVVAEAQAEAERTQSSLEKHLRKVISSKILESRKPVEYGETEKQAVDWYNSLHSFDNDTGQPTARAFAQKLVEKDVALAKQVGWDILTQPIDDNGMTVGHEMLSRMGLDPYKMEEYRQLTRGEIQGSRFGIVEVPQTVPPDLAEAYKALSDINRGDVDIYLDSYDESQKQAGLEILRNKQDTMNFQRMREETDKANQEKFVAEVNSQIEKEERETFTQLVESFKDTPTYSTATVSGIPEIDASIKNTISMAILQLADTDTVSGQQALKFFEEWGVQVNPQEISGLINEISGNIQTVVKADKGNYQVAKQEAHARKEDAVRRAGAKRNQIFAQTLTAMANKFKANSEGRTATLESNAGIFNVTGSAPTDNSAPKRSTIEIIQEMSRAAQQGN